MIVVSIFIWFKNGNICIDEEKGIVMLNGARSLSVSQSLELLEDVKKQMINIIVRNDKEADEIKRAIKVLEDLSLLSALPALRHADYEINISNLQAKNAIEKIDESIKIVSARKEHFAVLRHQKMMRHLQHQKNM